MKTRTGAGCGLAMVFLGWMALRWWKRSRFPLARKVVVITGGSRGLGLAMAREFARHGAVLALLARDATELEIAEGELSADGAEVEIRPCDVRNEEELSAVIEVIAEKFGGIDVLVNNAGEIVVAPLETLTTEDFDRAMAVHFRAPLTATLAALPHLRKRGESRIVNIASFGGRVAVPHLASYCASKFALVGLSEAMRAELTGAGVRVTTVAPGLMRTGSHFNALFKGLRRQEFTWFSLGAAAPLASIDATRAARQIVAAAREGRAELTVTLSARLVAISQCLFPNAFAAMMSVFARFLPDSPSRGGQETRHGWVSRPRLVPSPLTRRADREAARFNQRQPS